MHISYLLGSVASSGIEVPFGMSSIQTQDCSDMILENTVDVESTK
jgi:hypothetical protein